MPSPPTKLPFRTRLATHPVSLALGLCAFIPVSSTGQARFKIIEEEQTWSSTLGTSSEYLAAEEVGGITKPVVMAGLFDLEATFPHPTNPPVLISSPGVDTVFAGVLDRNGNDWEVGVTPTRVDQLEPRSMIAGPSPTSDLNDLAAVDRNEYYLTGIIDDGTFFRNRNGTDFFLTTTLIGPPERGFIAVGNDGTFTAAHYTDATMQPEALATDSAGNFLVIAGQERDAGNPGHDGDDAEVHRYPLPLPPSGVALPAVTTITDALLVDTDLRDVAVSSNGLTWVMGLKDGAGNLGGISDIWIGQADFAGNQILNSFRAGSEGIDRLGKMERGPNGEIYVAFNVQGRKVSFGTLTYNLDSDPGFPVSGSSVHAFLGMIKADGTPGWLTPLGFSQVQSSALTPVDLSIDSAGHAYITLQGFRVFLIEGVSRNVAGASQIMVNRNGRVVDYTPAPAISNVRAGAVPDVENRMLLGRSGAQSALSTLETLAVNQTSHVVCWVDPDDPNNTIDALSAAVTALGGQVHLETDFAIYGNESVSVWVTPDQLTLIRDDPTLKSMENPLIIGPDAAGFGEVQDPDWALVRLFDPFLADVDSPNARYYYPSGFVTPASDAKPVRVYVIDKALNEDENFDFQDLSGGGGVPIAYDGAGALDVDALAGALADGASNHPRQLVHMVAAADLGSAQGTAMNFINVDMYSGGSTQDGNCLTFASYVSFAILNAIADAAFRDVFEEDLPNLIVVASSGLDPGDTANIENEVIQALNQGITVVLSAGNGTRAGPGEVSDYVPAKFGMHDGVLTVGATGLGPPPGMNPTLAELNPVYPNGNTDAQGDVISLYAPGVNVLTGSGLGFGSATGTSFSCGLVAGLAATYLSQNPDALPAEVEAALIGMSVYDADQDINIARNVCSFSAWLFGHGLGDVAVCPDGGFGADSDGDGDDNLTEFLAGSDPQDPESRAVISSELIVTGTIATLTADLPDILVQEDGTLHTGCWDLPFELQLSVNLQDWVAAQHGAVTVGKAANGRQQLHFETDLDQIHQERCFLRLAFGPPASP